MDDNVLKAACRSYDEQRIAQTVQSFAAAPAHMFSRQFETKKQKILRRHESYSLGQNRFYGRRLPKKAARVLLAAALLLLLLLGTALAFEPVRHYIFTYFDGTDIIFRDDGRKDSLKETFSYIPNGYTLKEERHDKESNYWVYNDNNLNELVISSSTNGSTIFINTEDATFEEVDILGFTGYYVERDDGLILTWSTGKYHHIVDADITETSRITKEDIIKIARSRKN